MIQAQMVSLNDLEAFPALLRFYYYGTSKSRIFGRLQAFIQWIPNWLQSSDQARPLPIVTAIEAAVWTPEGARTRETCFFKEKLPAPSALQCSAQPGIWAIVNI